MNAYVDYSGALSSVSFCCEKCGRHLIQNRNWTLQHPAREESGSGILFHLGLKPGCLVPIKCENAGKIYNWPTVSLKEAND